MNYKGIDLNLMVAFDALYRERNVSRAGASIGISQPAMSAALARLRLLLDDHLFTRTSSGLQPTQRARDMAEPISMALQKVDLAFIETTTFEPAEAAFTFVVGMPDYPSTTLLPRLARTLAHLAPKVKLKVKSFSHREDAVELLDTGKIDIAIGVLPAFTDGRIQSVEIFRDDFVTIVSKDNPALSEVLDLEQFLAMSHVLTSPEGDDYGVVDEWLARQGRERKIVLTLPHMLAAVSVVAQTHYISTVLKSVAMTSPHCHHLVVLPPPIPLASVSLHILWHRRNTTHPGQHWIRDVITELAHSAMSDK